MLLWLLAATAAHAQIAALTRGHHAVVRANAPTEQEPLLAGPVVSDLGHGLRVESTARATPTTISIQTSAWRTRGSAVVHGAVGVSLIDAEGHVIAASGLHRFHIGWRRMWGSTVRSYRWTDPVPFDLAAKTASVVIHQTRTVAGLERRLTGPRRNGPPAVRPPAQPCVVRYPAVYAPHAVLSAVRSSQAPAQPCVVRYPAVYAPHAVLSALRSSQARRLSGPGSSVSWTLDRRP